MQQFEVVGDQKGNPCFSVSDAIDVLNKRCHFGESDLAEISVGPLRLPSSELVGTINVSFKSGPRAATFIIWLVTSMEFWAIPQGEAARRRFSIFELDGAKVDNAGLVTLSSRSVLRAVTVIPAKSLHGPTELDFRIIHHVIAIAGAEDHCYRSMREHGKLKCSDVPEDMIPDMRAIDCSTLAGFDLPTLKFIGSRIAKRDPALKNLSRQKIADALRKFGMRIPAVQPR